MLLPNKVSEKTRPTLYRGLKYWGKKPHNIRSEILQQNTTEGDCGL